MSEEIKKGGLSIDAKHIFPIIKKWLYSDKEIFVRELVSNGCDAVTKHKRLVSLGEAKEFDGKFLSLHKEKHHEKVPESSQPRPCSRDGSPYSRELLAVQCPEERV